MAMNPIGQGSDRNSDVGRPRMNVVPREVKGVRLERLRALRNSRAGYLGAMNRSQKDIELLLMDFANSRSSVKADFQSSHEAPRSSLRVHA
jgi:hypothetical protein